MSKILINCKCVVCGDKALGNNFGVITCESCKAFFRRNAHKINVFECLFDNNCEITSKTRIFCRTCRLNKCFAVGMKKELVLTEENRTKRRLKNESKRQQQMKCSKNTESLSDMTVTSSGDNVGTSDGQTPRDNMSITRTEDNITLDVVNYNLTIATISRPIDDYNPKTFNEIEFNHIRELLSATNHLQLQNVPIITSNLISYDQFREALIFKCESDIPLYVNMVKQLHGFNNLCESDQISLLKHGLVEMTVLGFTVYYDKSRTSLSSGPDHWAPRMRRLCF
ncbi:unnamed protein product [Medioppia subpectinata]|uniref:Nuclear receptor domain-containing protein n=1 Tax=Medioppia subpectinata TaxID=1979941 RepID=A0A7R9L140_9ACAR|nr:unnamed protein product [Medioppia subpectinata]CAG2113556.1 unnamed protein product [Medioppia subpectinata]